MRIATSNRTPNQQRALDLIRLRKQSYSHVFNSEDRFARIILADLARFCRADKSCFDTNPNVQNLLEGRREVWLRIAEHLNMTSDELYSKYVAGAK